MRLDPLSPKQVVSIRDSHSRINLWDGSVRSGKTVASLLRWAAFVKASRGEGDLVMAGKTERTLERNTLRPLQALLGARNVSIQRGRGEAWIFGRRVYMVGANDERAEEKIRGGTFEGLYGDELTLWPESFFRMGLSRLSVKGAKFFGTTNPDAPAHWLRKGFIDRADELDLSLFHFVLDDNPFLDPSFVTSLKQEYTGLWYKRFILGLWVAAEGAIWDAFDVDAHVVDAIPDDVKIVRWLASFDYGTSNPFVALLVGVDTTGRYWVADEWRWDSRAKMRQLTDAQYRAELETWLAGAPGQPKTIWGDPSATSFLTECRQHDLPVGLADNAVDDGLRSVATVISNDKLRILRRCAGLIEEIPGYVWDQKAQLKGVDAPVKVNDHGCDALRYAVRSDATRHVDLSQYGWSR